MAENTAPVRARHMADSYPSRPNVPPTTRVLVDGRSDVRGAGVDLLDVARFARLMSRNSAALERRLCTAAEAAVLPVAPRARLLALAGLFSVKESVLKSLGGICENGRFTDMCTAHLRPGFAGASTPHEVTLSGATAGVAARLQLSVIASTMRMAPGDRAGTPLLSWALTVPTRMVNQ